MFEKGRTREQMLMTERDVGVWCIDHDESRVGSCRRWRSWDLCGGRKRRSVRWPRACAEGAKGASRGQSPRESCGERVLHGTEVVIAEGGNPKTEDPMRKTRGGVEWNMRKIVAAEHGRKVCAEHIGQIAECTQVGAGKRSVKVKCE